ASHDVPRAAQPEPVAVDRVDVVARQVVRPYLHVVELREVRREQRPDRPAADDADPHAEYAASRALTSWYRAVCNGASTPNRSASRTSAPVIRSISVGRRACTSSSIDGKCALPRFVASTFISHGSSRSSTPAA